MVLNTIKKNNLGHRHFAYVGEWHQSYDDVPLMLYVAPSLKYHIGREHIGMAQVPHCLSHARNRLVDP